MARSQILTTRIRKRGEVCLKTSGSTPQKSVGKPPIGMGGWRLFFSRRSQHQPREHRSAESWTRERSECPRFFLAFIFAIFLHNMCYGGSTSHDTCYAFPSSDHDSTTCVWVSPARFCNDSDSLRGEIRNYAFGQRIFGQWSNQLGLEASYAEHRRIRYRILSVQEESGQRKGRCGRLRSMGRYPWIACTNAFLEGIKPYYAASTQRTIKRGLRMIGRAFEELKNQGKASTTDPRKMTQKDIEVFLQWMKERKTRNGVGLKPATQANYMEYLAAVLLTYENYVLDRMLALHYVRFPQKVSPEIKVLSQDSIERIRGRIWNMPGWEGEVARFMIAMYAYSGLRRSELRRARLQDLDTIRWTILVAHPKGETRYASEGTSIILKPAHRAVADFLKARQKFLEDNGIAECEMLVPRVFKDGHVGYWTDGMWGKLKDDIQRHVGIPFRLHQLRASFGQIAKDRKVSIETVSRALRHKTTRTTELYYARIRAEDAFKELEEAFKDDEG